MIALTTKNERIADDPFESSYEALCRKREMVVIAIGNNLDLEEPLCAGIKEI